MSEESARGGLFASLRGLSATGLAILHTRLALLATEVREEQGRVLGMVAFGAAALIFLAAGLVFLAIFLTVLLWDSNRLLVLGVVTAVFLTASVVTLLLARHHAGTPTHLFAASLAELAQDHAAAEASDLPGRP